MSLIHSCLLCYSVQIKVVSTSATQKSHGLSFRLSVRGKIHICPKYTLVLVHSVIWGKYVACSPGSPSFTFWINAIYSNLWQLFKKLVLHFPIYKEVIYTGGKAGGKVDSSAWSCGRIKWTLSWSQHCALGLIVTLFSATLGIGMKLWEPLFCFLKKVLYNWVNYLSLLSCSLFLYLYSSYHHSTYTHW